MRPFLVVALEEGIEAGLLLGRFVDSGRKGIFRVSSSR